MQVTTKNIAAGLGVLGVLAMAVVGAVKIVTPGEYQCAVDLADSKARLELLTEAKDACKAALETLTKPPSPTPVESKP